MSALDKIAIAVEQGSAWVRDWGNALPLLHEIRHGLQRLVETGESTLIDLRAIPFGPGDEERLFGFLGRGEVEARLHALGSTFIWESAIPAVWVVDHRNAEDERIALHIEIARVPEILCTQEPDMSEAVALLEGRIEMAEVRGLD